ncbi:MAG TPA: MFS transporter [Herpetosiphonaceae bacterium]
MPQELSCEESTLSPAEVRTGLKLSLIEGVFAQVHITLTAGAFLTGFALLLGAGNTTLGIAAALPFLIQPLQLLGAWLIERFGRRKLIAVGGSLGRLFWLGLMVLPYLPLTMSQRLGLLVVTLLISHALLAFCTNAWTNWMTDLVPPRLRGRYFGVRNTALAACAMIVNAGAGMWLDHMRSLGRSADGYAVLFGVGVICGAISTALLARQPEPSMQLRARLPLADVLRIPWRLASFRQFMTAMIVWNAALGTAASFFSAHALQVLHIPFTTLALFDVLTSAISLLSLPLWGRIADRVGHRRVLIVCMAGVIVLPWAWVLTTPTTLWILYLNAVVSGIWWPGLVLAQSNRLMEQVPREARGAYLALFAATTGMGFFVASTLAGGLADILANVRWSLGPLQVNNYQTLFIIASMLRGSVVLFWRKAL